MKRQKGHISPIVIILIVLLFLATSFLTYLLVDHYTNPKQPQIAELNVQEVSEYKKKNNSLSLEMNIIMSNNGADAALEYINKKIDEETNESEKIDLIMQKIIFSIDNKKIEYPEAIKELGALDENKMNDVQKARLYNLYNNVYLSMGDNEKAKNYEDLLNNLPLNAIHSGGGA